MGKPTSGNSARGDKKLSWSYRNKKRQSKFKNRDEGGQENIQVQNKKARIVVRNLSFKATEADVKKLYAPFGEIEQIDLLKRPDGKLVGCGFVQFKRVEDASKAIFNTNKQELLGRPISVTWAIAKEKYIEQIGKKSSQTESPAVDPSQHQKELDPDASEHHDQLADKDDQAENGDRVECNDGTPPAKKKKNNISRQQDRKEWKLRMSKKRARIVVRNLSFKVTEDTLRDHFAKYGPIEEIKLLLKSDGKLLGCAFIQFGFAQAAVQAVHYENMKPLLGRPMVVDRAVAKAKYEKDKQQADVKPKIDEIEIKEEIEDENEDTMENVNENASVKDESDGDVNEEGSSSSGEDSDGDIKEEEDDDDDDDEENDDDDDNDDPKNHHDSVQEEKRPRVISNDVSEGKTVFIKNVPFSVKNDELKMCMEQFGPVYYALVCMDPLTEHSKGTAFVKFRNVEDAEKCLSAGTELRLHDQVLDPHRALNRNAVQDPKGVKREKVKDSRNLYLVKEGVVLAGSPAAAGLSAADMAKRLQLEQWKSQMLRNLNMFVSRVRLVVHNLPPALDDSQLRQIFKKHAGPKAIIQEARVMRDMKNLDAQGIGKSKEFGFVAFTNHEDALKALRSVNNNPNVFSKTKRPIVAFSIENRVMVNAKKRRVIKSREHNPLWKNREKSDDKKNEPPIKRAKILGAPKSESDDRDFSGVKSKPGESKMRSKFNLKNQALLHQKVRKEEKKKEKATKKLQTKKRELRISRQEIKPRQGSKKISADEANFNKLVDNYKNKLQAVPIAKSKWYDT